MVSPTHHYIYVEVVVQMGSISTNISPILPWPRLSTRVSPSFTRQLHDSPSSVISTGELKASQEPKIPWEEGLTKPVGVVYFCVLGFCFFGFCRMLFSCSVLFRGGVRRLQKRWSKMALDGARWHKMVNLPLVSVKVTGPTQVDIETNRIYHFVGVWPSNKKLWMISWQWQVWGKDWGHGLKAFPAYVHHIFQGWGNWRCVYGGAYGVPLTMVEKIR